ncbi:acetate/propionate family kinase [Brytella acorum]|uniref:Acetate kinase n=1 Tax=Brytella acorum TaxID=2959299 RepID=A0AA35V859_9PROT|nr:acetate/propionate family kinase [Brytella acorum]MDF3623485.1 acetate/propionate family kinase [Brytella acorum]CAI9121382.1 acetate/propionate family kinase [Brytella acorum]
MPQQVSGAILVLNAGSSSVKFALFADGGAQASRLVSGELEGIGERARLKAHDAQGQVLVDRDLAPGADDDAHDVAMKALMEWLETRIGLEAVLAVGHRVVHGGPDFVSPVLIDDEVFSQLEKLTSLSPLHQPACLGPVRALRRAYPALVQVACFDTAFHRTMPAVAQALPLAAAYARKGVRRYGFHGLSYEHIARCLSRNHRELAGARVLAAHVGNGASLCALRHGVSIETTMGFSVLDGLVMGTRTGAIDPGVLLYMLRQENMTPAAVEDVLYHQGGLLGVSGLSGDMRTLREHPHDPAVRMALDLAVYRFVQQAGMMISALQGLDGIVFTGGIGEHDAQFRRDVCAHLAWLGVTLDVAANAAHRSLISAPESAVKVLVIPADEEASIHRHVLACIET